jgi:2-polyprenyl-3-methyl-5-hydroxy-6-metoxy-1,4-benzoquinol methylase
MTREPTQDIGAGKATYNLPWTGERYLPEVTGGLELEHYHRYLLATELASGKDVLDIASGEGFGSALLAKCAKSVVGIDIAPDAIQHAKKKYSHSSLTFKVGDCAKIPLPDASIDLVVSFETIEHHNQHEAMMSEIKRVLRPGGILIISSPDKLEYSVVPNYQNPHHVKELFREEFEVLLAKYFKNQALYGQKIVYGSVIFTSVGQAGALTYHGPQQEQRTAGVLKPLYWVAIASDNQLSTLPNSLLEQPLYINSMVMHLNATRNTITEPILQTIHENDTVEIAQLKQILNQYESYVRGIHNSRSWKIVKTLRFMSLLVRCNLKETWKKLKIKVKSLFTTKTTS